MKGKRMMRTSINSSWFHETLSFSIESWSTYDEILYLPFEFSLTYFFFCITSIALTWTLFILYQWDIHCRSDFAKVNLANSLCQTAVYYVLLFCFCCSYWIDKVDRTPFVRILGKVLRNFLVGIGQDKG